MPALMVTFAKCTQEAEVEVSWEGGRAYCTALACCLPPIASHVLGMPVRLAVQASQPCWAARMQLLCLSAAE